MLEDRTDILTAGRIVDAIGDCGITVAVFRVGERAEGGWELTALDHSTGSAGMCAPIVRFDAAVELAERLDFDLEE